MNTTMRALIQRTCFLSFISLTMVPLMKSMVRVELDVITREERVDMEAERTRMTTSPMSMGLKLESIAGMMASKPSVLTST